MAVLQNLNYGMNQFQRDGSVRLINLKECKTGNRVGRTTKYEVLKDLQLLFVYYRSLTRIIRDGINGKEESKDSCVLLSLVPVKLLVLVLGSLVLK
jgi:hypothetical protein